MDFQGTSFVRTTVLRGVDALQLVGGPTAAYSYSYSSTSYAVGNATGRAIASFATVFCAWRASMTKLFRWKGVVCKDRGAVVRNVQSRFAERAGTHQNLTNRFIMLCVSCMYTAHMQSSTFKFELL